MKNHNPSGGRLRFAGFGQRILAALVLGVCAYLVYLAVTGQYDHEVNRVAHWLKQQYHALMH